MASGERLPIIIPRLDDPASATADERDDHLMLLEAARHHLEVQWTECLGVADAAQDHHLFGFPSTVAYLKARLSMAGGRAKRYCCDSSIGRIVFGPNSEIIDVGRRTRVIPAALRRALVARDRRCTWPGCTRSPRWCDAHHVIPWTEHGETVLSDLRLLSRYHHTLTHELHERGEQPPSAELVGAGRRRST